MQTKDFRVSVKAAGEGDGLGAGQIKAVISVFGNVDSVGDVVMPGAFKDDLAAWEAKGDNIPFIWSHDWANPFSHIGSIVKAQETDQGLEVVAQIEDLDTNPTAAHVYKLLKGRRVTQFSFAYDVIDAAEAERDGKSVTELRKLRIFEGGPTLIGANQETELLAAKAQQVVSVAKAGRALSEKNLELLAAAHKSLGELLTDSGDDAESDAKTSEPTGPDQTDEPSQADEPATQDNEPDGAKSSEPARSVPRRARAVALLTTLS